MSSPRKFSELSTFTVFVFRDTSYIKMSQATSSRRGEAMRIPDGKPWLFDQHDQVTPKSF